MSMKFLLKRNDSPYNEWDMHQGEAQGESLEMIFKPQILSNIMGYIAQKATGYNTIRVELLKDGEEKEEDGN